MTLYKGGTEASGGTLLGWIENREDLQEVADALGTEVHTIAGIEEWGIPSREYVVEPLTRYFTSKAHGYSRSTSHVIGSWVDIGGLPLWPDTSTDEPSTTAGVGSEDGSES